MSKTSNKSKLSPSKEEQIVIYVEGGIVQAVYTNLAQIKVVILDKDQEDVGEPIRQSTTEPEPLELMPEEIARHL
jgi:hypothetical protein